ncbi:FAD-dependent oxidoreductase [Poseidonocella sp. HB161398]|uniref:flavin monoamine oxidase family protein n=1 Tax=Poseidonocella sp. HB161398 TaxID=2320855 RepID=UPI001109620D|nr:FAD-dependent oxidoreductase [Poseidonocella sp. HB161398]
MIGTAIVGGGLAGLALAAELAGEGQDVVLFEARERLGGRIRTETDAQTGLALDLGAAWHWPDQPLLRALAARLGLETVAQHDEGGALLLNDAEAGPEPAGTAPVHGGALRLRDGMGAMIAALAGRLGAERLRLGHVLVSVSDTGDHVRLHFADGTEAQARRAVLALPPRLAAQTVAFAPQIDLAPFAAMQTWMASTAKTAMAVPRAPWREAGLSGNSQAGHERAVLGETFDLGLPGGTAPGAIGGFFALDAGTRAAFSAGLPMLVASQMAQLFGAELAAAEPLIADWAAEPFTCAAADLSDPALRRSAPPAALRRALWQGRLYFAGSETAQRDPGHMEGALESAERVLRQLGRPPGALSLGAEPGLAGFAGWLEAREEGAFGSYRHHLNQRLARQQPAMATRYAALDSVEEVLGEALSVFAALRFAPGELGADGGRAETVRRAGGMAKSFLSRHMGGILAFNRSSCALRNFPEEHELPADYVQAILADVSRAGGGFLAELDGLLAARAAAH